MIRIILWALLAYFIYKFVFNFLVPVFKVSRQMKRQVKAFRDNVQQQQEQFSHQQNNTPPPTATPPKQKAGDYIDFEEMK